MLRRDAVVGTLLGTAVGDALGLPYEGLSKRRARKLLGEPDRYRFFFGRGMVSDDTEHTCMVARALIAAGTNQTTFERTLASQLRRWVLCLPAGVGLATLKATTKLLVGVPPSRSGVRSAGNGPAMRSAILGVAVEDPAELEHLLRVATRITHTDPRAYHGAVAVALAARCAAGGDDPDPDRYLDDLTRALRDENAEEMLDLVQQAVASASRREDTESFAVSQGLAKGISGFVNHTVPTSIHAWLTHPDDFRGALQTIICCGGDADTTGAIVGGIVGARVGKQGIPPDWLDRLVEWPRTVRWLERLADQVLAAQRDGRPRRPIRLPIWCVLPRNLAFLLVVLAHGLRRLLPPY